MLHFARHAISWLIACFEIKLSVLCVAGIIFVRSYVLFANFPDFPAEKLLDDRLVTLRLLL